MSAARWSVHHDEREEVTCGRCGRDHIPDEGDPTQADTCWECQNGYGDDE